MEQSSESAMGPFLKGDRLYGDDFDPVQIAEWHAGDMVDYEAKYVEGEGYHNHVLNRLHAFRHLPSDWEFTRVLSLGGGSGDELAPIASRIRQLDVVEPGEIFGSSSVQGVPTNYHRPGPKNELPFSDSQFDLVLGFGVLHHIPNVSFVLSEISRCLSVGGYACFREPIVSMGDWRYSRSGLTSRERGIPLPLFRNALSDSGLEVIRETRCLFGPLSKLGRLIRKRMRFYEMDSVSLVYLDALICRALAWNGRYHATSKLGRVRPTAVTYVVRKT